MIKFPKISFKSIQKIKTKFLIQFGILIFLSSILTLVMIYSIQKIDRYNNLRECTNQLKTSFNLLDINQKNYILNDLTNESYFENKFSNNTKSIEHNKKQLIYILNELEKSDELQKLNLGDTINYTSSLLNTYIHIFQKLQNCYLKKGYIDFGLEGELRTVIHKIEKGNLPFDKVLMLTLRRNEKDFFLLKTLSMFKNLT